MAASARVWNGHDFGEMLWNSFEYEIEMLWVKANRTAQHKSGHRNRFVTNRLGHRTFRPIIFCVRTSVFGRAHTHSHTMRWHFKCQMNINLFLCCVLYVSAWLHSIKFHLILSKFFFVFSVFFLCCWASVLSLLLLLFCVRLNRFHIRLPFGYCVCVPSYCTRTNYRYVFLYAQKMCDIGVPTEQQKEAIFLVSVFLLAVVSFFEMQSKE